MTDLGACDAQREGFRTGLPMRKAVLWLTLGLALVLRMYGLAGEDVWYDEAVSFVHLDAPDLRTFISEERALDPPMTPVYFTLQYGWARLFGRSNFAVRMLSVLMGVATVYVVYRIGRAVYGPWPGLFSAVCLALSPMGIRYSQELRTYPLVLLLAAASLWTLIYAQKTRHLRRWWLANAAINALLVWTQYFAAFVPFLQGLFVAAAAKRRPRLAVFWFAAHVAIALSLVPWILRIDAPALDGAAEWISGPSLGRWFAFLAVIYTGGRINANLSQFAADAGLAGLQYALALLAWSLVAAALWDAWRRKAREQDAQPGRNGTVWLLLLLSLGPPTLLAVVSLLYRPCFVGRYTLYAALPLFVLVGGGLASLSNRRVQAAVAALYIAVMATLALSIERPIRPPHSRVASFIGCGGAAAPPLMVTSGFHLLPMQCYSPLEGVEIAVRDNLSGQIERLLEAAGKGRTAWLVGAQKKAERDRVEAALKDQGLAFTRSFLGGQFPLTLYEASPANGLPAIGRTPPSPG